MSFNLCHFCCICHFSAANCLIFLSKYKWGVAQDFAYCCVAQFYILICLLFFLSPFTTGLPNGVLPPFQGLDWETCVSIWLDGHDHGTEQVTYCKYVHTHAQNQFESLLLHGSTCVCPWAMAYAFKKSTSTVDWFIHTNPHRDKLAIGKLGSRLWWWKRLMWQIWLCVSRWSESYQCFLWCKLKAG